MPFRFGTCSEANLAIKKMHAFICTTKAAASAKPRTKTSLTNCQLVPSFPPHAYKHQVSSKGHFTSKELLAKAVAADSSGRCGIRFNRLRLPLLMMPTPPKITLRVQRPSENNDDKAEDRQVAAPLSPGIVFGSGPQVSVQLRGDPHVDAAHGTLERTPGLGVWVYSDHSEQGSVLNGQRQIHHDAVVVKPGDKLRLGQTEIELAFDTGKRSEDPEIDEVEEKQQVSNQESELSARSVARLASRRASTPWGAASVSKAQQAKQRLPKIDTSGLGFEALVEPTATPPEYSASPVPGTRWRRKRNSIATTTLMARRSPSPPREQHTHLHSFHRPRTRFVHGEVAAAPHSQPNPETRPFAAVENAAKIARPPPLEYSSSPSVSPSSLAARQRHSNIFQQPPSSAPHPASGLVAGVPPPPFSVGARPSSRRDDLRIQVSKKMAAAAPASAGKANVPRVVPKVLEFQAPASPVAQRDILKQQESLQTILQHKFDEEQLLKQQQEEWMKQNLMPGSSSDSERRSGSSTPTPPLSPIKSEKTTDVDPDEVAFFPARAPVLLRTLSLGLSEQRTLKPSPRLTAAIRASRARLNSFEERPGQPTHQEWKGRHKTTALVLSPRTRGARSSLPLKENALRTSDESVASTATTVIACHRRVTSSLSSGSACSVDLCDFLGYEEEEDREDAVTSYTTPDMYGSAELLRRSREDTTLMFEPNPNSNSSANSMYGPLSPPPSNTSSSFSPSNADARIGSPRRHGTETPDTSSSSSNQLLNDSPAPSLDKTIALGPRVWSPRGGHFDPQSPYKSTAALKSSQQPQLQKMHRPAPAEPEDGNQSEGTSVPRQPKPQPFRRRASFRRHSLTPLTGLNKP